jgi:hypothetical protein
MMWTVEAPFLLWAASPSLLTTMIYTESWVPYEFPRASFLLIWDPSTVEVFEALYPSMT